MHSIKDQCCIIGESYGYRQYNFHLCQKIENFSMVICGEFWIFIGITFEQNMINMAESLNPLTGEARKKEKWRTLESLIPRGFQGEMKIENCGGDVPDTLIINLELR